MSTEQTLDLSNGGAIRLKVNTSATKGSNVSLDEFIVRITSTTPDEQGQFPVALEKQYADLPYSIVLRGGNYVVSAQSGANLPFSTAHATYYTEQETEVQIGQTTAIELSATLKSYVVDIVYSDELKQAFKDFYVEALVDNERYPFARNDNESGFFAPGSATLVLRGTTVDGKPYSSIIKEVSSVGRERFILRLGIRPQGHIFKLTIEQSVEQVDMATQIGEELYPDMPELGAPEIVVYETAWLGESDVSSVVNLNSITTISDVELTFADAKFAAFGLETERVYRLTSADDVAALLAAGVDINASLLGQRSGTVSYRGLANRLLSYDNLRTQYKAQVEIKDMLGKSAKTDINIAVLPPVFALSPIPAGSVWARKAYLSDIEVTQGDKTALKSSADFSYQISTDNGATWSNLTAQDVVGGLNPSTSYSIRTLYRGHIASNTVEITTEANSQVVNAGMEDWQLGRFSTGLGYDIPYYYPWNGSQSEWWSTSNCRSVRYTIAKSQKNNIPGVMWSTAAHTGSRAAEIRNVHVDAAAGQWSVRGELLIGTFRSDGPSGGYGNARNVTEGRPFESRPTKLRFWYKYEPYGSANYLITVKIRNNDTQIAAAEVKGNESVTSYTLKEIEIPYSNTELKATSIYINFAAAENDSFDYRYTGVNYPDCWDGGWSGNKGSVLNIDDIELIYE